MAEFIVIKLFGIAMVSAGVVFLIIPDAIKKYLTYWTKAKRVYTGAGLSVLAGIIFLLVASQCKLAWFVALLGIWAIVKGIILFVLGPKKFTSKVNWCLSKPPGVLRMMAVLALVIGTMLVCSV
ncbi:MAG: hypothetical protein U9Q08_03950 [Candidatus Omnitrophota bacterium]|nr:hypothetical protein [Candidatus Omnitrophota bacterium]